MDRTYYQETFPPSLELELQSTWADQRFSRRVVVARDEMTKEWVLFACALSPVLKGSAASEERFEFEQAVLVADTVSVSELSPFLRDIPSGLSTLTGKVVGSEFHAQCDRQPLTVQNYWMKRPGALYTWRTKQSPNVAPRTLLSPQGPYYPDVEEAARDWLRLGRHAGQSESHKGELMLLLPETRASIENSSWSQDDEHLTLEIAGSLIGKARVLVKGAYWRGKSMTQLHEEVVDGSVTLAIPREADRLELNLLDDSGTVYEHHREQSRFGRQKGFLGSRHRMSADRIVAALREGEGIKIEFKEFLDLPGHKKRLPDGGERMKRFLRTVAAFANTDGGTVFIGISDDIRVVGTADALARGAPAAKVAQEVERYAGGLRASLANSMYLPVNLDVSIVEHKSDFLVLVEVPPSEQHVSVSGDGTLYKRHGASNRAVPPDEWAPRESDFLLRTRFS